MSFIHIFRSVFFLRFNNIRRARCCVWNKVKSYDLICSFFSSLFIYFIFHSSFSCASSLFLTSHTNIVVHYVHLFSPFTVFFFHFSFLFFILGFCCCFFSSLQIKHVTFIYTLCRLIVWKYEIYMSLLIWLFAKLRPVIINVYSSYHLRIVQCIQFELQQ